VEASGEFHAPAALPPGKSPRYPLDRRLRGLQSRSGRHGEVKILTPTGTRTWLSSPQPVAIPTTLSRLRYLSEEAEKNLRKTITQNNLSLNQDLKPEPQEYIAEMTTTLLRRSGETG
jgi:hypothetical protein